MNLTLPKSLILLVTLLTFSYLLGGCALFKDNPTGPPPTFEPNEKVFRASFDEVWKAVQLSLQKYPIKKNIYEDGVIETDFVTGYQAWQPPHKEKTPQGWKYQIVVRVIKGNAGKHPAQKVSVAKNIVFKKDFFTDEEQLPSDGLEEQVLMYRIEREVFIDQALKRAAKAPSK